MILLRVWSFRRRCIRPQHARAEGCFPPDRDLYLKALMYAKHVTLVAEDVKVTGTGKHVLPTLLCLLPPSAAPFALQSCRKQRRSLVTDAQARVQQHFQTDTKHRVRGTGWDLLQLHSQ